MRKPFDSKHQGCALMYRLLAAALVLGFWALPAAAKALVAPLASPLDPTVAEAAAAAVPVIPEGSVSLDFSGPLPLLVLGFSDTETPPLQENNYFFSAKVSAGGEGTENILSSAISNTFPAAVQNLTDHENTADKKHDYFLRFQEPTQLLGLPAAEEFFLLGAMDDKSLIRNYLGYSIAREIFSNAPNIQLCELLICRGETYAYRGVYLLVAPLPVKDTLLLQRSDQNIGFPLETYADLHDPAVGNLFIPLRDNADWDDSYNEVLGKLSWAEEVLYHTDSRLFYEYQDMYEVDSFVAAFILGELTENYQGMQGAYYYFHKDTGLISFAPLWNFANALDNAADKGVSVSGIRYPEATYFRQFFKSPRFASQIQTDYLLLRRNALNEQTLLKLLEEAEALAAPVAARDWERWNAYGHVRLQPLTSVETDEGTIRPIKSFSRQRGTYEDEILRIKTQLREHSLHFAVNLTQFNFQEREISKEIVLNSNPIWLVVFLVLFFMVVRFVRKYGV